MNLMGHINPWRCGSVAVAMVMLLVPLAWAQGTSSITASIVVKVSDRDHAAEVITAAAEKYNGYFTNKSQQAVVAKVPAGAVDALMIHAMELGEVINRRLNRVDLGNDLVTKRAALKARQDAQRQYEALIKNADVDAVLYVEKELIKLVAEIETLKGAIRHLEHRIAFAQVRVAFEFQDRPAPVADGRSSFEWLNTMNLTDLLRDF